MSCLENNSNESRRNKKPADLEEWLQLPDSNGSDQDDDESDIPVEKPESLLEESEAQEEKTETQDGETEAVEESSQEGGEPCDEPEEQKPLLDEAPLDIESDEMEIPLEVSEETQSDVDGTGSEPLSLFPEEPVAEEITEGEEIQDDGLEDLHVEGEREDAVIESPADETEEIPETEIEDEEYSEPEVYTEDQEDEIETEDIENDIEDEADIATEEDEEDTPEETEIIERNETERLEVTLAEEFRDTLTGANAFTLPIGVLFLIIAVFGWTLGLIMTAFQMQEILEVYILPARITAALLTLGGLHLLFYWGVHRISNFMKVRELDRLIESRRWKNPCIHLNCREIMEAEEQADGGESPDEPDEDSENEDETPEVIIEGDISSSANEDFSTPLTDGSLTWHCDLYDVSLDNFPICAVCDRYEAPPDPSDETGQNTDLSV